MTKAEKDREELEEKIKALEEEKKKAEEEKKKVKLINPTNIIATVITMMIFGAVTFFGSAITSNMKETSDLKLKMTEVVTKLDNIVQNQKSDSSTIAVIKDSVDELTIHVGILEGR